MRADDTLDEYQAKMAILTCMSSSVASRLEAAVGMDCRERGANEHASQVWRAFL